MTAIVIVLATTSLIAWYVAAAEERGLYDQPWQTATSLLWNIARLTDAWWFAPALYFSGGVAVTLWAGTPAARRRQKLQSGDSGVRLTDITSSRLAIIDAFTGFLETGMRPAAKRGRTLLAGLPQLIEQGAAEQELADYASSAARDFTDLQRLTRLYRQSQPDLTDIVAATMEFNYFEVVAAARALASVLAHEGRQVHGDAKPPSAARDKSLLAFESALQRLESWVDARARMLAARRAPTEPDLRSA